MYPAPFDYRKATSVEEALSHLSADPDHEIHVLAGGHGLLPAMKTRELAPDLLVDVSECEALRGIDVWRAGGTTDDEYTRTGRDHLTIGATTTHAELADSPVVADHAPVLAEAARAVGDVQIRTRGTVGGNLVEADPGADLPAAMVAAGAVIRLRGPNGEREVPAHDFFVGEGQTAIDADELLTAVRVPAVDAGAYVRRTHPARGFAMVGVAVAIEVAADAVTDVGVAAVGATDRPVRLESVEDELVDRRVDELDASTADENGDRSDSPIGRAAALASTDLDSADLHGDVHASGPFRASILGSHVERAVASACDGLGWGEDDA